MKMKNLFFAALAAFLLGSCAKEEEYTPKKGGVVDTLHNEIHVKNLKALNEGGFDHEKDVTKVYITEDDGFKYIYDAETETYVLAQETDTVINFYFDGSQTTRFTYVKDEAGHDIYTQVDAPIYVANWYMTKPLGACPEEIDTVEELLQIGEIYGFKPQGNFTHFVGFSVYPSCLGDEEHLWDFKTNYKQQAITNLYGIWVDD